MSGFDLQTILRSDASLSVGGVLFALGIGFLLSLILRWHFHRFASSFSNKREFGAIFPLIVLTVTLVIAIVKSSLALSLGLVGALSIVRFRTPIKEPEELAYIFMAIAIGLGLGANQILITSSASVLILVLMAVFKGLQRKGHQNLYLSVVQGTPTGKTETVLDPKAVSEWIREGVDRCDLRRIDVETESKQLVYYVEVRDVDKVFELVERLRRELPAAEVSLIDQHRIPGV